MKRLIIYTTYILSICVLLLSLSACDLFGNESEEAKGINSSNVQSNGEDITEEDAYETDNRAEEKSEQTGTGTGNKTGTVSKNTNSNDKSTTSDSSVNTSTVSGNSTATISSSSSNSDSGSSNTDSGSNVSSKSGVKVDENGTIYLPVVP